MFVKNHLVHVRLSLSSVLHRIYTIPSVIEHIISISIYVWGATTCQQSRGQCKILIKCVGLLSNQCSAVFPQF
ncbi:hypothetical protein CKAN_02762500 [Cinnamomum micranthum f. kanehirae]|uniref:Uncharacterized protein n=1 Tax=Cinnamomum micranthum f. kanehirae TaxID=337451 RepID=A0A3S3PUU1_9MAGN|nr:hypothetical protein CKAN_02762500 [Cinnamomum micranthum f. kanehirae]